jgi:hypothetical protein
MRRILPLLLIVVALMAAGCGSSSSSSSPSGSSGSSSSQSPGGTSTQSQVHFAKTKFVLHAALAFGVFHHFIYKPFKNGDLRHPLLHKLTFVKAALAGLFVVHEIKLALAAARGDKLLSKVVAPLDALSSKISTLASGLKHGKVDTSSVNSAESATQQIKSESSAAGQPISETTAGAPF